MMSLHKWIGITGNKEVGKDTAALALIAKGYHRIAFADPVRRMALAIDPVLFTSNARQNPTYRLSDMVESVGWDKAKQHPEVRRLLQRIGTEAGRQVLGHDIWVETADREAAQHDRIVFTDVRFDNEATYVRRNGGIVVRIIRDGRKGDDHTSEQGICPQFIDAEIHNDSSIEVLHERLMAAAAR
jgi:hypothetical protein